MAIYHVMNCGDRREARRIFLGCVGPSALILFSRYMGLRPMLLWGRAFGAECTASKITLLLITSPSLPRVLLRFTVRLKPGLLSSA